jgi:hypothetical protein
MHELVKITEASYTQKLARAQSEENTMTIITNTGYLHHYPFLALSDDVVTAMGQAPSTPYTTSVPIKLFEVFCHVTDTRVCYADLSSKQFRLTVKRFLGTLYHKDLVDSHPFTQTTYRKAFIQILDSLRSKIPTLIDTDWTLLDVEPDISYLSLADTKLNHSLIRYWNGWQVCSGKKASSYLKLSPLWLSHGQAFTEQFYEQCKEHLESGNIRLSSVINKFVRYLALNSEQWPPSTFYNPTTVRHVFLGFMRFYFLEANDNSKDLIAQNVAFAQFINLCTRAFIESGVWATPFERLPKPEIKRPPGTQSNIRKSETGVLVHDKLLTEIPISITDNQAIDILFKKIDSDLNTIRQWALEQVSDFKIRIERRNKLAKTGTPSSYGGGNKTIHRIGLANICATFNRDGFITSKTYTKRAFGDVTTVDETSKLLALPTTDSLFPFQCLLVMNHPEITESFLKNLELYNPENKRTGFIEDGNESTLVSYKDRKGKNLSLQAIRLTQEETAWIRLIIDITSPLREALRSRNDKRWRELFLTCGQGFADPGSMKPPRWYLSRLKSEQTIRDRVTTMFHPHTHLRDEALLKFIDRISLTSIRSSAGVSVYLQTGDGEKMSQVLGHTEYNPELLRRYLPDPILEFFQSRWVRIFQKAIICETMKSSPHLAQATKFESMDELHEFLQNHALSELPSHIKDPEGINAFRECSSELFISVNPGALGALMSLESAVNNAKKPNLVSGKAKYWASISKHIVTHIKSGTDSLLKKHLNSAIQHINPNQMAKLIYEPSF